MLEIVAPALLIGCVLAALAGPLGSFVVWGRMSYFGDTLAHSAILGICLGFLLNVHPMLGVFLMTTTVAIVLSRWQKQRFIANDTLLGIIAHGTLAAGLVLASLMDNIRIDLMGLLFGDILSTTYGDVLWVLGCGTAIGIALFLLWRPLLNSIIHRELAIAEGVHVDKVQTILLVMLAFLVAVGMKIVGALLITAILIIPAAGARRLANTPEQMALIASAIGIVAVCCGISASVAWNTPAGPSIILSACLLFTLGLLLANFISNRTSVKG